MLGQWQCHPGPSSTEAVHPESLSLGSGSPIADQSRLTRADGRLPVSCESQRLTLRLSHSKNASISVVSQYDSELSYFFLICGCSTSSSFCFPWKSAMTGDWFGNVAFIVQLSQLDPQKSLWRLKHGFLKKNTQHSKKQSISQDAVIYPPSSCYVHYSTSMS